MRAFLIQNGYTPQDVDSAIKEFQGSAQNPPSTLQQPSPLESQLRSYIASLLAQGYNPQVVRQGLLNQGYDASLVDSILTPKSSSSKKSSGKTVLIIFILLLMIGIGAALYFFVFSETPTLEITAVGDGYKYYAGDSIPFTIAISSSTIKNVNAQITYTIIALDGSVIQTQNEKLAVSQSLREKKSITLPKTIAAGTYTLKIRVDYGTKFVDSSIEFMVMEQIIPQVPVPRPTSTNTSATSPTKTNTFLGLNTSAPKELFGAVIERVKIQAAENPNTAIQTCKGLSAIAQRDACIETIAEVTGEYKYCSGITNIEYRDGCYLAFVMKGETIICAQINDVQSQAYCKQISLVKAMEEAYKRGDQEEVLRLSEQFEPKIYNSNPDLPSYKEIYGEESTLTLDDLKAP
ncbi:MAG: hypothetical protein WC916_02075 [Candidatus Woesearchaeota archaeon]